MKHRIVAGVSLAIAFCVSGAMAGADLKSGPQEGKNCTPFHPLNVTGSQAGQKHCLV